MKKFNNNSGFTLIEIIIVLIIVGVLAAIALPNLYSNIAKSKGAEAISSFGPMKAALEACGTKNGGASPTYSACSTQSLGASGQFTYNLGDQACANLGGVGTNGGATGWCLWAYPTAGAASSATNYITLNRLNTTNAAGSIVCTGFGTFSGIC